MSFLLDTCTVSELTRPRPDPGVLAWFDGQDAAALHLSVLSVGEIEKGIAVLPRGRKRSTLTGWLATLRAAYADRILPIDDAVAAIWGRTAARVERGGRTLGVVDGLLAATAVRHGFTLVTRNVADFEGTGAAVLNVWTA